MMRVLMPRHVIFVRGTPKHFHVITAEQEAQNAAADYSETEINSTDSLGLPIRNVVAVLPREAYEWQKDRQLDVSKRGHSRKAR
jgi:hypothetical protein